MKRKAQIRGSKGITLLALVITIVIIIILATITINMAFGENGLVEKAEQTKNMTEEAARKEQEGLANAAAYINEVIYGNGGEENPDLNGEPGTNIEEPDTNEVVDTNTVEPPVEIPGGEEEGAIVFGAVNWSNGTAKVEISTETEYEIEYQVNGTEEGSWETIENKGEVTDLGHGDIVNARLTDGENHGNYASLTITDSVLPANANIELGTTSATAGDNITVKVTHIDNESGVNIGASKWVFNTTATNIGTEEGNYTETFTTNSETINIPTSSIGIYYLHVLTVDKAGNKIETISEAVVVNKIEGDISIGSPTWSDGTSSVELSTTEDSYTIMTF